MDVGIELDLSLLPHAANHSTICLPVQTTKTWEGFDGGCSGPADVVTAFPHSHLP